MSSLVFVSSKTKYLWDQHNTSGFWSGFEQVPSDSVTVLRKCRSSSKNIFVWLSYCKDAETFTRGISRDFCGTCRPSSICVEKQGQSRTLGFYVLDFIGIWTLACLRLVFITVTLSSHLSRKPHYIYITILVSTYLVEPYLIQCIVIKCHDYMSRHFSGCDWTFSLLRHIYTPESQICVPYAVATAHAAAGPQFDSPGGPLLPIPFPVSLNFPVS